MNTSKSNKTMTNSYYKLGLQYLVTGAQECLVQMQECDQNSKDGQGELCELSRGLVQKVHHFCVNHLKSGVLEEQLDSLFTRPRALQNLEQELRLAKNSKRRLKRANLRLKKRVRSLKVNLGQVKYGLARYMKSVVENPGLIEVTTSGASEDDRSPVSGHVEQTAGSSPPVAPEELDESQPPPQSLTKILNLAKKLKNKAIQAARIQEPAEESKLLQNPVTIKLLASKVTQNLQQKSALKKIAEMKLKVTEVRKHKEGGVIGEDWTRLAMKNHNSYMIGTNNNGFKLIENSILLYSEKFPGEKMDLSDLIYVRHSDCYLMSYDSQIYRKDININQFYPIMEARPQVELRSCLRYSEIHQRVIVALNLSKISAINLKTSSIEIQGKKISGGKIQDFQLFGERHNLVISLTQDGDVTAHELDFKSKKETNLSQLKLDLFKSRNEIGTSLAVCDNNQLIFAEISQRELPLRSSRMMVLECKDKNLRLKVSIDRFRFQLGKNLALKFFGYVGSHALVIGLSRKHGGVVQVFGYNAGTEELRELEEKRLVHEELEPAKIVRLGDQFYYSGCEGKVMKLSVQI